MSRRQKIVYQNAWTTVYEDEIQLPDGSKTIYGYIERIDGVIGLVLDDQERILLVKQYRYPVDQPFWELTGGGIDAGESLEAAAQREVLEETGLTVTVTDNLGEIYPLGSVATEKNTILVCRVTPDSGPIKQNQGEADEEFLDVRFFSVPELLAMIDRGEIVDALTASVIQQWARRHFLWPQPPS